MFLDRVRTSGVQFINDHLPQSPSNSGPGNFISHYVINEVLKPHNEAIENSEQYQEFLSGEVSYFTGTTPHSSDNSPIHNYLWGYSIRKGFEGKLAGLMYRVMEFANEFLWGRSDRLRSLEIVEDLLQQKESLSNDTYTGGIVAGLTLVERKISPRMHQEADLILKEMLLQYNSFVNS